MKENIVVIEPHGDDAFLSLHQHMVNWVKEGKRVIIVTVLSGTRKRARDSLAYAESIGATWIGLGYDELTEWRDSIKDAKFIPETGGLMSEELPLEDVDVIVPLAIQHEDHIDVRAWVERTYPHPIKYYMDIPYYLKAKNEEEVNDKIQGMTTLSIIKPKFTKGSEKFWKCFKDQSKFFWMNPPDTYMNIPEIILRK